MTPPRLHIVRANTPFTFAEGGICRGFSAPPPSSRFWRWPSPPAVFAQSQATTGVIEGTVLDASGAPVPGATVTIRNTATNFERVIQTDGDGRFRGLLLPLGPYRVTVALAGFATLVRDGINLAVGQTVNLDLNLKVSNVQEEVVVTGAAPARRDLAGGGRGPHRRRRRRAACPTTAATSSTSPSSPPASASCRARTATS